MGRASPDLPDPLENQDSAPSGGADDLLSQLAGDEIDRLLAEADVEATPAQDAAAAKTTASSVASPAPTPPTPTGATSSGTATPELDAQLNDLFNALNAAQIDPPSAAESAPPAAASKPVQRAAPATAAPPGATPPLDAQLNELFNALNDAQIDPPPAAPPAPEPAQPVAEAPAGATPGLEDQLNDLFNTLNEAPIEAPPAEAAAAEVAPAAEVPAASQPEPATASKPVPVANTDLDDQLSKLANELLPTPAAEEQEALTPVDAPAAAIETETVAEELQANEERAALLTASPSEVASEEVAADEEEEAAESSIPWLLRPLLWLNLPFASLSDGARDRIGKVALATLLFSITVLMFLAVTRHRL